ncbi:hypothetical protein Lal_00032695 [Lupinus albus]|uniref:Integral membrane bound transporter domain-containing protein n=1 Tax=Lupinus albus TaxID=3870 RepID=A0A6A4R4S9_LUPAL|nr:hypothetical protein Lalb_Chr01g0019301 [Lupinus albus]KAF1897933.1 hypothetical protein Lal_00032695 [Lupinus albus]
MSKTTTIANTRSEIWLARLGSALRTTLACTIVGCTTFYAPEPIRNHLKYPAFSYVTTILIVSDATLGDTLRGCWHVLIATLQVMILSLLTLHVIGPENFTSRVAAVAVVVCSFVVALPESTHLMTKRIAFGQFVIVYVSTVIHGAQIGVVMHPIHVASSTTLGAIASVLAMLFPYPRLSYYQARKFYRLYTENASERLNCNVEAITASDNSTAVGFSTQAKSLSTVGAKLLHSIRSNMDGMQWESPLRRVFNPHSIDLEEKLQDLEIPIRGMDIALSSCTSFPVGVIDEDLRSVLLNCREKISQKLDQKSKCFAPYDATKIAESKKEILNKNLTIAYKDLPTSFFLYCLQLLLDDSPIAKKTDHMVEKTQKTRKIREFVLNFIPSNHNLAFASKCSLSLGLAVLFGLMYNKENGYWSGLTIAISFVTGRQPIFSVANARGQGTAMGSIYGILCCFIFQSFGDLKFLSLLPWIVFCSFLRHSRMYGQAGGISAVIGALLILGRKHYGPPTEFAVARITEATIGLICFIMVELLSRPSRASTLVKYELSQSLRTLQDCIGGIPTTITSQKDMPSSSFQALRDRHQKLKSHVYQLEEFAAEAESEPNFWFLPFHSACHSKMLESLSRMLDLLLFVAYSMEQVTRLSQKEGVCGVDFQDRVKENIELFKKRVGIMLKCLEEIIRMKSLRKLENDLKNKNLPCDIESGEYPIADAYRTLSGNEEVDSITGSFLQLLEEMANKTYTNKDEEMLKGQLLFHYRCLGFCTNSLMRETLKIESEVKELLIWENASTEVNLKEIYCKISSLRSE